MRSKLLLALVAISAILTGCNNEETEGLDIPSNYLEVNGIKVAVGNLVADGPNGAKIGAPTDNGLYFQFGSLIGWSATGDPTIAVKPIGYSSDTTWNRTWSGDPSTEDVTIGTGDPCKYYLKGNWRLPTKDEYVALFKDNGYPSTGPWKWNDASKSVIHTSGLTFPAAGIRFELNGGLSYTGTNGHYWSSSNVDFDFGFNMQFDKSELIPSYDTAIQQDGYPVRCVQTSK